MMKWLPYCFLVHSFSDSANNANVIVIVCALPFLHRPFALIFQDFVAVNLTVYTSAEFPLRCMYVVSE